MIPRKEDTLSNNCQITITDGDRTFVMRSDNAKMIVSSEYGDAFGAEFLKSTKCKLEADICTDNSGRYVLVTDDTEKKRHQEEARELNELGKLFSCKKSCSKRFLDFFFG